MSAARDILDRLSALGARVECRGGAGSVAHRQATGAGRADRGGAPG
jgi:hypothetical protein